jgi:NADH dehydrogenase FAD-containing subunit
VCRIELDGLAGPIYTTSKGRTIKADAHFVCIGKRVGSSWLRDSELSSLLDDQGRLKVDANLRVEGKKNVFACGDIANTVVQFCALNL